MKTTAQLRHEASKSRFAANRGKTTTNPLQLQGAEEEPLQMKQNPLQLQGVESAESKGQNKTGLPDQLKSGIENLSGQSVDDVRVHYNSSEPAQLNALAYAQGTDIHVAPGQEKHLPHEAWHVVQQMQGRVQPTVQMKDGVAINDDKGLENEADLMGEKATSFSVLAQNADINKAFQLVNIRSAHIAQQKIAFTKTKERQITQFQQESGVVQLATKKKLIEAITGNYNQGVAMFPGNEGTPITHTFTRAELIKAIVGMGYSGTRIDFRGLMESMRDNEWCVAAWVHSGGLGGAAGGADPEPHITVMVNGNGIHVRVETGSKLVLKNAKGTTLESRGPEVSNEVDTYPGFTNMGLTLDGQKKASEYATANATTVTTAVAYVKSGCPDVIKYTKGTRQLRYHADSALFGVWDTANGGSWVKDIRANAKLTSRWIA